MTNFDDSECHIVRSVLGNILLEMYIKNTTIHSEHAYNSILSSRVFLQPLQSQIYAFSHSQLYCIVSHIDKTYEAPSDGLIALLLEGNFKELKIMSPVVSQHRRMHNSLRPAALPYKRVSTSKCVL